ncbi:hypothetical protein QTP70_030163 [Hemibagrus guttatus]|uniref:Paired domain-containing protein n=1 Tax=Hemibagrus guttatus TaxID=175788 RepID=A0AAE0Q8J8_9TELE|nr:hypothetical protein QTP70_030163 [Hemibagrus guttatus]
MAVVVNPGLDRSAIKTTESDRRRNPMDFRRFLPDLRNWSLREIACAAGLLAVSAGAGYCIYRHLRRQSAAADHTEPAPDSVEVLGDTLDTPSVLQVVEPNLLLLPTEPHHDSSAVSLPPSAGELNRTWCDVQVQFPDFFSSQSEEFSYDCNTEDWSTDIQVVEANLQLLPTEPRHDTSAVSLESSPFKDTEDRLTGIQAVVPYHELLPTTSHNEPSAFVLPLTAGKVDLAWNNIQFLSAEYFSSQSGSVNIKMGYIRMIRGPECVACWLKTTKTCYLNHMGFPYDTRIEDCFTGIKSVSGRVTEYLCCNRIEASVIVALEDYVHTFKKVTCTYLRVTEDGQVDTDTWVTEGVYSPHSSQSNSEDCEERFSPEEVEVPFISCQLSDREVTDIGLKLPALRQAFATILSSDHNQNFLFLNGKEIVMRLAAANNQCLSEVKMGRGSPIPPMLRRKIVEQYQKGVSQRKIAKSLKLSSSTEHNIIQRFRESGTISVRKGQGRKTILDARDLRALRRHCITYRNATVMEITTWAQEYFQKTLSVNTIHRAIRRCRLKLYRSKKNPYLNMIQKRRRFLWAKAHLKWTVAKWKTVLWSDESKFEVLFGKLGRHVIRTKEDKDNPSCYQRSVQKPASLMVWGCMSACGMGSLHIWKGTINAERSIHNIELVLRYGSTSAIKTTESDRRRNPMDFRRFLPDLRNWSLREIACAAGLLAVSAGAGYCIYRHLRRQSAAADHTEPAPDSVEVLGDTLDTPSVLQVVEPNLLLLPTEPHHDTSAVSLPPSAGELNRTWCDVQVQSPDSFSSQSESVNTKRDILRMLRGPESRLCDTTAMYLLNHEEFSYDCNTEDWFTDIQVVEANLQLLPTEPRHDTSAVSLESSPFKDTEDRLTGIQAVVPYHELLPTTSHDEPSAFVLPLTAGKVDLAWNNIQFLSAEYFSSQSGSVNIKMGYIRMIRGPECVACWLKTTKTCYLNHMGFPYDTRIEDCFTGIKSVSGRVTEYLCCNRMEASVIVALEDYVHAFKKVTCTYLRVTEDGQVDTDTWVTEGVYSPHSSQSNSEDCEERFSPEEVEVPFISCQLSDREVTDIGLKLPALRQAFATILSSDHNQNFLFLNGKKIVMRLAAANNQLHFNFVDIFYELLVFGYFCYGLAPETFEGGFLQRLMALISMWDLDVWEPAAGLYFTVLIDQLTELLVVLFSQPLELYEDPEALATVVLRLIKQHVQLMMDTLEKL